MRSIADVSLDLVHCIVNQYERYGQAIDPGAIFRRGRRMITVAYEDFIRSLVVVRPSIHSDETRPSRRRGPQTDRWRLWWTIDLFASILPRSQPDWGSVFVCKA